MAAVLRPGREGGGSFIGRGVAAAKTQAAIPIAWLPPSQVGVGRYRTKLLRWRRAGRTVVGAGAGAASLVAAAQAPRRRGLLRI